MWNKGRSEGRLGARSPCPATLGKPCRRGELWVWSQAAEVTNEASLGDHCDELHPETMFLDSLDLIVPGFSKLHVSHRQRNMDFKGIADPSAFKATATSRLQCMTIGTTERGGLHFLTWQEQLLSGWDRS